MHGRYRLCIGGSGLVRSVTALDPSFDTSGRIAATLRLALPPPADSAVRRKDHRVRRPCVSASDARATDPRSPTASSGRVRTNASRPRLGGGGGLRLWPTHGCTPQIGIDDLVVGRGLGDIDNGTVFFVG